jgi:hypothetical protein
VPEETFRIVIDVRLDGDEISGSARKETAGLRPDIAGLKPDWHGDRP